MQSYNTLTINADSHSLMSRMHKPDPRLPADQQDKRSVIPIEMQGVDQWLAGTQKEASELLRLAPVSVFDAVPAWFQAPAIGQKPLPRVFTLPRV